MRLNSSRCTKEHFRALWRRLSSEFRGNQTVVAYDLMNEPVGHSGIAVNRGKSVGKTWEEITSLVHADLRRSGDKKIILIPTYAFWSGAIPKHHPRGPWIRSDAKVRYSVHCFFDRATSKASAITVDPRPPKGDYARHETLL